MRRVTINVTQAHINKGLKARCNGCPIALAIKEALGWDDAWVDCGAITIGEPGHLTQVLLPERVIRWYEAFDKGETVRPFSFKITCQEEFASHAQA